jgi:hypothetical protein
MTKTEIAATLKKLDLPLDWPVCAGCEKPLDKNPNEESLGGFDWYCATCDRVVAREP